MNINQYLKAIKILFLAMLMAQILFLVVSILVIFQTSLVGTNKELSKILLIVSTACILIGVYISNTLSRKKIAELRGSKSLLEKLQGYRTILIIKYALLEAPSFLTIVSYLLTGNTSFLLLAFLIIVVFAMNNPTKDKLIFDLELNREEQEILNNPNSFI